ncbi:MAG: hypothetical protein R2856_14735 [Caldilineaceae bacterium]
MVVEVVDIYPPDELQYLRSSLTTPPSLVESGKVGWADITDELGDIAPGTAVSFTVTFRFTGAVSTSATNVAELGVVLDENRTACRRSLVRQAPRSSAALPPLWNLLSFVAKQTSRGIQITWATGGDQHLEASAWCAAKATTDHRPCWCLRCSSRPPAPTAPTASWIPTAQQSTTTGCKSRRPQQLLEYGPIQVRPMPNDMSANVYFLPGIVTNR